MASKVDTSSFCNSLETYVSEYNEITGIHGLRYLTEKRSKAEKVFWWIVVLLSLAGCFYMIYEIVKKYESSPVVLSFAPEVTPIYQIPFPSITICPESKFSKNKLNYADIYYELERGDRTKLNETILKQFSYVNLLCEDGGFEGGNQTVDTDDFFETIQNLAPPMDMYTTFLNRNYPWTDLFRPIIIDQGVCYTFNILDRTKIFRSEVAQYKDFHRVLNASDYFHPEIGYGDDAPAYTYPVRALMSGADNSFDIFMLYNSSNTDYICNSFLQGFRILVHNPWDVPRLSNHYFRVPLNKTVVAAVDPELIFTSDEVKKLRPEKRKCYLIHERPLRHFHIYTQSNCLFECLTNYTLNKCGCVSFFMPRDNSTAICGSNNYNCTKDAKNELKIKDIKKRVELDETYCDCKPQCTNLKFHIETSHSSFYWRDYFEAWKPFEEDLGVEHFDETDIHWSVVSIYLKEEQFIALQRVELYGLSDFISNFGGLLGLFTGFSIVSLAEIIYFSSVRIYCNVRLYGHWSGPRQ